MGTAAWGDPQEALKAKHHLSAPELLTPAAPGWRKKQLRDRAGGQSTVRSSRLGKEMPNAIRIWCSATNP